MVVWLQGCEYPLSVFPSACLRANSQKFLWLSWRRFDFGRPWTTTPPTPRSNSKQHSNHRRARMNTVILCVSHDMLKSVTFLLSNNVQQTTPQQIWSHPYAILSLTCLSSALSCWTSFSASSRFWRSHSTCYSSQSVQLQGLTRLDTKFKTHQGKKIDGFEFWKDFLMHRLRRFLRLRR